MEKGNASRMKEETVRDKPQRARRGIFLGSALAIATGCLCCITPLALVLFGLASIPDYSRTGAGVRGWRS